MSKSFDLPVWYHGKELFFPAELMQIGYTHKIKVNINETDVLFEPDEERNWRAQSIGDIDKNKKITTGLLQAIVHSLEEITK